MAKAERDYSAIITGLLQSDVPSGAPAHPDAALLFACAEVMEVRSEERVLHDDLRGAITDERAHAWDRRRQDLKSRSRSLMVSVGRLPATTPAGIFAKAQVLRRSRGNAPMLALSLANDLTNAPGLRAALWPADREAE